MIMRFFLFGLVFSVYGLTFTYASQVSGQDQTSKIHVKKGRSHNYYHLEYTLTPNNLVMRESKTELALINEGGHFVVYIKKEAFPVLAPACNDVIELNMPRTRSTRLTALDKIAQKTKLYKSLQAIASGAKKEQKVIVELNPDIVVKNENPVDVELTRCHVYFRTARDAYVDYIGKLK